MVIVRRYVLPTTLRQSRDPSQGHGLCEHCCPEAVGSGAGGDHVHIDSEEFLKRSDDASLVNRVIPGRGSTSRSRSLCGVSSPRATDPNTRGFVARFASTIARISSRWAATAAATVRAVPMGVTLRAVAVAFEVDGDRSSRLVVVGDVQGVAGWPHPAGFSSSLMPQSTRPGVLSRPGACGRGTRHLGTPVRGRPQMPGLCSPG